ncbi:MAG: hypothetical protein BWY99_01780 [Synergistetes bacterium ADurb.BinA166]|nr:MAG: hypothetical protein BWY99_01780 [Synergistetes bacterium ADurb.BinA166]
MPTYRLDGADGSDTLLSLKAVTELQSTTLTAVRRSQFDTGAPPDPNVIEGPEKPWFSAE